MPITPEAARQWNDQAQFDYVGPFVKAWAAFNAWYRHHSAEWHDNKGIKYVCSEDNQIRNMALPRIRNTSDQAMDFKRKIAALHDALSEYDINKRRNDGTVEIITFTAVCIQKWNGSPCRAEVQKVKYKVEKANGKWVSTIVGKKGDEQFRFEQDEWNIGELDEFPRFVKLAGNKAPTLRQVYSKANPRPILNLLNGDNEIIDIGAHSFKCSPEDLFTGLVTIIYDMRNSLLHGELKPNDKAFACYEPAFRILKDFMHFAEH